MTKPKRSGTAAIGWLLTFAGAVAIGTLVFSIFSSDYRRSRFFSLLQGDSSVDGIGIDNWLLLSSPLLVIGLGVALIAVSRDPAPAQA